ncbi:thioesterase [candidate division KSB1 bacterium]|nr:thioesterase [candidate division KSB1 bacterium]RQW04805.1 MAG: thioesterase [candidate division KSB1 bacterium]
MIDTRLTSPWLLNFIPRPDVRVRVFCFHYAGGNANVFRGWDNASPEEMQIVPIELPGHGSRLGEPLLDSVSDIVREIAQGIAGYLDKPFVFFGHSMGALISFELTRFLRRYFLPQPVHLFVSAHAAPHVSKDREHIHRLPEDEFTQKLRTLNGTPDAVLTNPELRELFLPIIRNDFKVCETFAFKPGLPLECPITVYGGINDTDVQQEDLAAWEQHTTAGIQLRQFDGDHFFLHSHEKEVLQTLVKDLSSLLDNHF